MIEGEIDSRDYYLNESPLSSCYEISFTWMQRSSSFWMVSCVVNIPLILCGPSPCYSAFLHVSLEWIVSLMISFIKFLLG